MRVRLEDVAAHAGVSVATVSRVLGNRQTVAEATRARVLTSVEVLGYSRSTLLSRKDLRMVAVCPPGEPERWQVEVCREVSDRLQDHGLLVASPYISTDLDQVRAAVAAGAVAAVTPTFTGLDVEVPVIRFDEYTAARTGGPVPVAAAEAGGGSVAAGAEAEAADSGSAESGPAVERTGDRALTQVAAAVDLAGGMTLAFDHLAAIGHRRIGLICNDTGDLAAQLRARFLAEHPARTFTTRLPDWIAPVPKSSSGGSQAALRLKDATCTALIVQSGLQLHGALSALRDRRLLVPRDMSVVGFGDSLTMRYTRPPATVLRLDTAGLANALVAATRTVLGLPGDGTGSVPPVFRPRLLARGSTAAARE